MNAKRLGTMVVPKVLLVCAFAVGTAAQAAPIVNGQFTLQQDFDHANGIDQGEVVASVDFEAIDSGLTDTNGLSIFDVTRLELTDLTALLDRDDDGNADGVDLIGAFLFEPPTGSSSSSGPAPLQAFFGPGMTFAGINGGLEDSNPQRFVFFDINNGVSLSTSTAGTLNVGTGFTDSFNQVPEPTALALLGAGILGFGATRRRRTQP